MAGKTKKTDRKQAKKVVRQKCKVKVLFAPKEEVSAAIAEVAKELGLKPGKIQRVSLSMLKPFFAELRKGGTIIFKDGAGHKQKIVIPTIKASPSKKKP